MYRGQAANRNHMIADNWQLAIAVVQQATTQQPCVYFEIRAPQPALDHYFPPTDWAEEYLIVWIVNQTFACLAVTSLDRDGLCSPPAIVCAQF
jgi:hypothetical protein